MHLTNTSRHIKSNRSNNMSLFLIPLIFVHYLAAPRPDHSHNPYLSIPPMTAPYSRDKNSQLSLAVDLYYKNPRTVFKTHITNDQFHETQIHHLNTATSKDSTHYTEIQRTWLHLVQLWTWNNTINSAGNNSQSLSLKLEPSEGKYEASTDITPLPPSDHARLVSGEQFPYFQAFPRFW